MLGGFQSFSRPFLDFHRFQDLARGVGGSRGFPGGFPGVTVHRISRDFPGFSRIFQDFPGFSLIFQDFRGFSGIFLDFHRFQNLVRGVGGSRGVSRRLPGVTVHRISQDFPGFSWIFLDFLRFSSIFPGFSSIFSDFPGFS